MTPDTNEAPTFAGEFVHGVDTKGRLTIPSDWRKLLEVEIYYVVTASTGGYFHVMPPLEFQKVADKAEAELPAPKKALFLQNFFSRATKVATDKQGRILLPEKRNELGMSSEVVLVGCNRTFKLYNQEKWEAIKAAEAAEYEELGASLGV